MQPTAYYPLPTAHCVLPTGKYTSTKACPPTLKPKLQLSWPKPFYVVPLHTLTLFGWNANEQWNRNAAKCIVERGHFSSIKQKVSRSSSSLASNSVSSMAGVEILIYLPPTSHLLTCASACIWHLPIFVSAYLYFCISREVRILAGTLPGGSLPTTSSIPNGILERTATAGSRYQQLPTTIDLM